MGQTVIWSLNGTVVIAAASGPTIDTGYNLVGWPILKRTDGGLLPLITCCSIPALAKRRFGTCSRFFGLAPLSVRLSPLAGPWPHLKGYPPSRG